MSMQVRSVVGAAALVAGLLVAPLADRPDADGALMVLQSHRGNGYEPRPFEVRGRSVKNLYPGATGSIDIAIANPNNFDVKVISLRGKVESSSKRHCAPSPANLRVDAYTGRLPVVIKARGRTDLRGAIPVVMPRGASQACAGARFTIALVGLGAKASR